MKRQVIFADANELILLLKGQVGRESHIVNCKDIQRISFARITNSRLFGMIKMEERQITIICKKLGGTILFDEHRHMEHFDEYLDILRRFCAENSVTFYDFPQEEQEG